MKKKFLTYIILILGAIMILAGIILLCQAGSSHTGHRGGLTRASTSTSFGADFYTTSAQATGLAANAVIDLYTLTSIAAGIFFMFIGGIDVCVTLMFTDIKELFKKEEPLAAASQETPDAASDIN